MESRAGRPRTDWQRDVFLSVRRIARDSNSRREIKSAPRQHKPLDHQLLFTFLDSVWRHFKGRRRIHCTQQKLFFLSRRGGRPPPYDSEPQPGKCGLIRQQTLQSSCSPTVRENNQRRNTTHSSDLSWSYKLFGIWVVMIKRSGLCSK